MGHPSVFTPLFRVGTFMHQPEHQLVRDVVLQFVVYYVDLAEIRCLNRSLPLSRH